MAQKIKSMKQKLSNGTYSNAIPFGADAVNVDLENGYDLETALGSIEVETKGSVQNQLNNIYTKTEIDTFLINMISWETVETWEE